MFPVPQLAPYVVITILMTMFSMLYLLSQEHFQGMSERGKRTRTNWYQYSLFTHSPTEGHLSCFHVGALLLLGPPGVFNSHWLTLDLQQFINYSLSFHPETSSLLGFCLWV